MSTAAIVVKLFSELKQIAQQKRYKAITGSCNKQISMSLSFEQAFSMLIPLHTISSLHENPRKPSNVFFILLLIFFMYNFIQSLTTFYQLYREKSLFTLLSDVIETKYSPLIEKTVEIVLVCILVYDYSLMPFGFNRDY